MDYRKAGIAIIVGITLFGGGAVWWNSPSAAAKRAVEDGLKDPSSAIFTGLQTCKGPDAATSYVTGYVNARNSFGAMTGKQRFMVEFDGDGAPSVTIASDDPDDSESKFFAELARAESSSLQDCYVLPAIARSNALAAELSGNVDIDDSDVAAMAAADADAGAADAAALDAAAYEAALANK